MTTGSNNPGPASSQRVAYIALGSNLGDREPNLAQAIERLSRIDGCIVSACSPSENYPAVNGRPDQPDYLNAVAAVATTLSPFALLARLAAVEAEMGRPAPEQRQHNQDRIIDLDLLLYEQAIIVTVPLVLPHPQMHRRRFVLEPLCRIAPEVLHPALGLTARQLLEKLPTR